MKKISITTLLLLASVLICLAATAITGTWKGVLIAGDGSNYPVTYNFKTDGDKLSGTAESPMGHYIIEDGIIKGDTIKFKVEANGEDVPHTGKAVAGVCPNVVQVCAKRPRGRVAKRGNNQ